VATRQGLTENVLRRILEAKTPEEAAATLGPRLPADHPLPASVPGKGSYSTDAARARQQFVADKGVDVRALTGEGSDLSAEDLRGNVENFLGYARMPIGLTGPLRINGTAANGDFYVPLATTEGALVASYNRGMKAISESGGATAACLQEGVGRAPCFEFESLVQSGLFLAWALPRLESAGELVSAGSRHCRLQDIKTTVSGKEVYLLFEYTTGDAAGQNMVTLATDRICRQLVADSPIKPKRWYVEANMSGDKKATQQAFTSVRGKKVVAEVKILRPVLERFIHVCPEDMVRYWQVGVIGGVQSGSIGVQGHYANALTALFIACGQDAACVSEAAVGITRMDVTDDGHLYVMVNLPNMIVGTVGGGTRMPTARACLDLLGCNGAGHARKFAEICAVAALAGEISIQGALVAGEFTQAHAFLGRRS